MIHLKELPLRPRCHPLFQAATKIQRKNFNSLSMNFQIEQKIQQNSWNSTKEEKKFPLCYLTIPELITMITELFLCLFFSIDCRVLLSFNFSFSLIRCISLLQFFCRFSVFSSSASSISNCFFFAETKKCDGKFLNCFPMIMIFMLLSSLLIFPSCFSLLRMI